MAAVVLVHGIDQQQKSADTLEDEWLPDLAGGVRAAGFPEIAERLWRLRNNANGIESRMVFYGGMFLEPDQQGGDLRLINEEVGQAEQLARAWLENAAHRSTRRSTSSAARRELAILGMSQEEQMGAGRAAASAISALARVPYFAPLGWSLAERFINRSLAQVTRYFVDESIRTEVVDRTLQLIQPDTRVVLGHSLGSVVAWEAMHLVSRPVPLLITIGSPLGLQRFVYPRLRPQPATFPPLVKRWVNVVDRDDCVAAEPDLTALFPIPPGSGMTFAGTFTVDNGAKPHSADFYLTKPEVGLPIGEALSNEPRS